MQSNISSIIDYIYDNIRYGTQIQNSYLEELFSKFSISQKDRYFVYGELKSLNVKLVGKDNKDVTQLFILSNNKKEITEESLLEWLGVEVVDSVRQENIRKILSMAGYTIVNDRVPISDDLPEDLVFDNLDLILDEDEFITKVDNLHDVIDKSHNNDYLMQLNSEALSQANYKKALANLVEANIRLVWSVVRKYEKFATAAFDSDDMYQAGIQGLMKAAEKFDISLGNQFSTYAVWWIRQAILREIANYSTTIRVPVHTREKINKLNRIEKEYYRDHAKNISTMQLSKALQISVKEVNELFQFRKIANLTSLDIPVGEDGVTPLLNFIRDEVAIGPEECSMNIELKSELRLVFNQLLNKKEQSVVSLRFGLADGKVYTLEKIGEVMHITRERVRQIEAKSLKKLGMSGFVKNRLKGFEYK